jgi:hypothetical protein
VGTCTSNPVVVYWHWYYPALPISPWALIAVLLIAPKANRNRRAWLILIPVVVVLSLWRATALLLGIGFEAQQQMGCLVTAGTIGWTAVWLLGHWLGSRFKSLTFLAILAIMAAVGALSFFCCGEGDDSFLPIWIFAIYYGLGVVGLTGGMMLAGRFCRQRFSAIGFGLWLLLWTGVVTVALPTLILVVWIVIAHDSSPGIAGGLVAIPFVATLFAAILYVFNLPFLIVSLYSTFYCRRLETMFRAKPMPESAVLATTSPNACIETGYGLP